jgi:hypothetical protein
MRRGFGFDRRHRLEPHASAGWLARWQQGSDLEALERLLEVEILALKERIRREAHGLTCAADSASDVAQEVALRFLRSSASVCDRPRRMKRREPGVGGR